MTSIPASQWAVQLVGPDQLVLNQSKEVFRPGSHQILAKVEVVGLCFSDLKLLKQFTGHVRKGPIVSGIEPDALTQIPSYVPNDKPTVPGHETVVRIVEVGPGVTRHKVGERHLVQTDYRGAFPAWSGTDELWVSEWTYMDFLGMLWRPQYSLDCGDANADGSTDVSDAVWIINYVFVGGLPPDPLSIGDANCDVSVDVSDAVWIIIYVFVGGNPPCELNGDAIPDC